MAASPDIVVIGGGAAGLAAAIFAARHGASERVLVIDGARRLGAKILISGGGRCNVTNTVVTEKDFWGGNPNVVRNVLRGFPVRETVDFFREIGVALHEEEDGKLFPDSNRAQTVLSALLTEAEARGVRLAPGTRARAVRRKGGGFEIETAHSVLEARKVVLATGGLSVPKTGSDGAGYAFAQALGHGIVPTTPALEPLLLQGDLHARLRGVAQPATIDVAAEGARRVRLKGSLLFTHFGLSGPVVLNASRFWHRAALEGRAVRVLVNLAGERTFESVEDDFVDAASRGRATLGGIVSRFLPSAVADAVVEDAGLSPAQTLAALSRDDRRRLVHRIVGWEPAVTGGRGYNYAEATAGGVPLGEIDPSRMESRACPGLHLVGEVLDVDGRIGGFNFQWAWSSGYVAGRALAAH